MSIAAFVLIGAAGGAVRPLLDLLNQIHLWRSGRRHVRSENAAFPKRKSKVLPSFVDHVDVVPEIVAAVAHVLLGALAGGFLGGTGQIDSVPMAVLAGASAPALLAQFCQVNGVHDLVDRPATAQASSVRAQVGGVTDAV